MRLFIQTTGIVVMTVLAAAQEQIQKVSLEANPKQVLNRIDESIYGHFFEHIYHSANGGLWGDLVWNRSFESMGQGQGIWVDEGDSVAQLGSGPGISLALGDPQWKDYEISLEAQKLDGPEGFLILCRRDGPDKYYWLNLGGWGNARHGFEKGQSAAARVPVGASVAGSIEPGRWYHVRVRCEGNRLQAWLDNAVLLDVQDTQETYGNGCAGLGTWFTKARFRNIKVSDLDGKTLFEGKPLLPPAGPPQSWQAAGKAVCVSQSGQSLNGERCLRLSGENAVDVVQQTPFRVEQGEIYRGSLWLKGEAPAGLAARLLEGDRVLAECAIAAPSAVWREFPLVFRPTANANDAVLRITFNQSGSVCLDQVSLMPESWRVAGGFRPDLLAAIESLRPPIVRWPGGCYAEFYRWKDGIGPQHTRGKYPLRMWDDEDVNSLGTDEFLGLCRRLRCEPLIVINTGRHDGKRPRADYVAEACAWLEYCNGPVDSQWGRVRAANGHPEPYGVKYWEIDNETWPVGAQEYVQIVKDFVPALRAVDPTITIMACGSAGFDDTSWPGASDAANWNQRILDGCAEYFDYLSVHHYENPDLFATRAQEYEAFLGRVGDRIKASANPRIRIFVSEWNAQSTDWRTGLYAAQQLNGFERQGAIVGMAAPALFLRHTSANDWDNAFINFDHKGWFPAPNCVVMKLWRDHYAPKRIELTGQPDALNAVATLNEDAKTLIVKLANPSEKPMAISLRAGGARLAGATMRIVAPGSVSARNTLAVPDAVKAVGHPIQVDGESAHFELPALSAGVASIVLD